MTAQDGACRRSMLRRHDGLSADARLLEMLLAPHWKGDGKCLRPVSVYGLFTAGQFPSWEVYTDALAELHAFGFISTHGRRGRPCLLLTPDLPSLHMAGAEGLLADRLEGAL